MAGAGKKTFVAGEVLTAAQVNDYLMDQAVMRFADASARSASITAPTEGMVTYLDDVNRIEIYDGSAWQQMPTDQDDLRNLITAKGDILTGAGSGSIVSSSIGADNTVLTADSTAPGGVAWREVSGGRAALFSISTASTNTTLSASLPAGYYSMQTSSSLTFTSAQFRFVAPDGSFFGAALSAGAGTFTIPEGVASVNVTQGTPMTGLIQEITGISSILENGPTVTGIDWAGAFAASFTATASAGATALGIYNLETGSFATVPASGGTAVVTTVPDGATYGLAANFRIVQQAANGTWSKATTASATPYPFYVYTANNTYTPPPGSASAEIVVAAGGGGGGGSPGGSAYAGGGGAGGYVVTTVATPSPVSITIGSGGSGGSGPLGFRGANGGNSSFGPTVATGGGGGGAANNGGFNPGNPGGSGGGGGAPGGTGGSGTPGQGFAGASPGGGGGASASASSPTGGAGSSVLSGVTYAIGGNTGGGASHPAEIYAAGGRGVNAGGSSANGGAGNSGIVIVRAL